MHHAHEESYRPAVTINSLSDDILLEMFAFYLSNESKGYWYTPSHAKAWQKLVQVCQRWQQIIYGSPHYLDLHHYCSCQIPFRKILSRWPEFPLTLCYTIYTGKYTGEDDEEDDVDDLIAALEQPDRVHHIHLRIANSDPRVGEVLQKMKVPFPALTHLELMGPDYDDGYGGVDLPRDFLGESAPCLQHLRFDAMHPISFKELKKLLLSARGLVNLQLEDIPATDYFRHVSSEVIVGGLAGLTSLRTFCIKFRFPEEFPDWDEELENGRLPPESPMRAVLPALTEFAFAGESEYLDDLVARIDMPSVKDIKIEYFSPGEAGVDVRQLSQFIRRTENLDLAQFKRAQVDFDIDTARSQIKLDRPQGEHLQVRFSLGVTTLDSPARVLDDIVTRMARVLGQLTALLSNLGHLSVNGKRGWGEESNRLDNSKLLRLLHPFSAVEELHVSGVLAGHIATVLENIAEERVTEVMPALRSLQLGDGDELAGSTERFLSLRQLSGHPVAVVNVDTQDKDIQA